MLPLDSLFPLIPCPSAATHRHPALRLYPLHPSSSDVAGEVIASPCSLSAPPPSLWCGRLPRLRWLSRCHRCDSTTTSFRPVSRPPRPFPVASSHRSSSGTTSPAVKYDPAQQLGFGLARSRCGSGVAPVTKIQHVAAGSHLARGSPLRLYLASPARLVAPLLIGHHSSQLVFNLELEALRQMSSVSILRHLGFVFVMAMSCYAVLWEYLGSLGILCCETLLLCNRVWALQLNWIFCFHFVGHGQLVFLHNGRKESAEGARTTPSIVARPRTTTSWHHCHFATHFPVNCLFLDFYVMLNVMFMPMRTSVL